MKSTKLTVTLFVLYLILLSWIVLMKARFSFVSLYIDRSINLIPFGGMLIHNGLTNYNETIYNVLVFVPFGVFICMLRKKRSFVQVTVPIILLSLFFEVIQYIFAIGVSDITDLLANTFGGMIGIGVFFVFHKICKENGYKVLNIIALVSAIGLAALVLVYGLALYFGVIRFV